MPCNLPDFAAVEGDRHLVFLSRSRERRKEATLRDTLIDVPSLSLPMRFHLMLHPESPCVWVPRVLTYCDAITVSGSVSDGDRCLSSGMDAGMPCVDQECAREGTSGCERVRPGTRELHANQGASLGGPRTNGHSSEERDKRGKRERRATNESDR